MRYFRIVETTTSLVGGEKRKKWYPQTRPWWGFIWTDIDRCGTLEHAQQTIDNQTWSIVNRIVNKYK